MDLLVASTQTHNYSNSDINERSFTARDVQLHSRRQLVGKHCCGVLQYHWLVYWPAFLPWTRTSSPAELGAAGCCSRGYRTVRRRKIDKIFHDWSIVLLSRYIQSSKPPSQVIKGDVCIRRLLWIYTHGHRFVWMLIASYFHLWQ